MTPMSSPTAAFGSFFDGTGAYTDLQGTGDLEGTVDDAANLITRIYAGLVHLR